MRAFPFPREEEPVPLVPGQAVVRLRLIGQMEAWTVTSENVLPAGRKTRALLAAVALAGPRPALRGRLAELLWSRRLEEQARASLRQEIHRLLEVLAPAKTEVLQVTRDHLSLKPGAVWIDVEEVMRATTADPAALSLLDGELLEDLIGIDPTFDMWLTAERERLRDRARSVAEALLREQHEPATSIAAAQRLLQIDRAHEGAWRTLMRAYAEQGERGMAMQAYDRCRAVLADLLDAAPSADTQQLLAQIRGPASPRTLARPAIAPRPPQGIEKWAEDAPEPEIVPKEDRLPRGGAHVGVLPMQCVGLSEEDAYLGPGLADEITTALARFRWMFVVSASSLTRFAQNNRDETAIRQAIPASIFCWTARSSATPATSSASRCGCSTSGPAIRWSGSAASIVKTDDLLSMQDEIAAEVVAQIDPGNPADRVEAQFGEASGQRDRL